MTHITYQSDDSDSSSSNSSTISVLSPQLHPVTTSKQASLGNHDPSFADNFHPPDPPEAQRTPPASDTNKSSPPSTSHDRKKDNANLPPTKHPNHNPAKKPIIDDLSAPPPETSANNKLSTPDKKESPNMPVTTEEKGPFYNIPINPLYNTPKSPPLPANLNHKIGSRPLRLPDSSVNEDIHLKELGEQSSK